VRAVSVPVGAVRPARSRNERRDGAGQEEGGGETAARPQ